MDRTMAPPRNFAPFRYYLPAIPYVAALAGVGALWLVGRARARRILAGIAAIAALGTSGVLSLGVSADFSSAHLSQLDEWQYRSGWPAGGVYARAAELIAGARDIDGGVYLIDERHLVAAGAFDPTPGQAWVIAPDSPLPPTQRDNCWRWSITYG